MVLTPYPASPRPASWGPLPREVPGYAEAVASGVAPRVPRTPPELLPGPSARGVFTGFLFSSAVVVGLLLVLLRLATQAFPMPVAIAITAVAAIGGGALIVLNLWPAVGRRCVEEFHAGYTTLVISFGGIGWGAERRKQAEGARPPWDYSGLWIIDAGEDYVLAAPEPGADAPGYYPSPSRPGTLELWTGATWAGRYRD